METVLNMLAKDHAIHRVLFMRACTRVRQAEWRGAASALSELDRALGRHLEREAAAVLQSCDGAADRAAMPTAMLRVEQRQLQGVLARMALSVESADRSGFHKHAGTLRLLLQYHNQKQAALYGMESNDAFTTEKTPLRPPCSAALA
ncbi:MAG TPA: hemerythrin domain-containing protein [Telluria sp.]|jgi:hypothetical protein